MARNRRGLHYGWYVLANGLLVVFGSLGLARFGYTLVLPAMQEGLGMANTQAGALATSNLIGYLTLSVVGGAFAVRFGPRLVITLGLAAAAAGMIMTGLAESVVMVGFWRAVTGVGSGASNVPVMALLASWFGRQRRGLATGIASSGSSVALIILGPLAPLILARYADNGWRVCWFLFGFATAAVAAVSWAVLRNSPSEKGLAPLGGEEPAPSTTSSMQNNTKIEYSTAQYIPVQPSLAQPYPVQTSVSGTSSVQDSTSETVSVKDLKLGTASSQDSAARIRWGDVYRSGAVWHLGLVYVAFGFSYIIYMTFFFKHLTTAGGYTREAAGALFMMVGWLSLCCGLVWGAVSDRIGRKMTLIIVYLIQAVSFVMFGWWATPTGFTLSAVLFGLTAWSVPAIMAAACGDILGSRLAPAALGFITLFFGIGQAAGPSLAGAIADASGSFHAAFILAGAVSLLGALGAAFIRTSQSAGNGE